VLTVEIETPTAGSLKQNGMLPSEAEQYVAV